MRFRRCVLAAAVVGSLQGGCSGDDQQVDCSTDGPPPCGTQPPDERNGNASASGSGAGGLEWELTSEERGNCTRVELSWQPEPTAPEGSPASSCLTLDSAENFLEAGSGSFEVGNNGYVFGLASPDIDDLVFHRSGKPDVHATLSGPAFVAVFPEWNYEGPDEMEVQRDGRAIERCGYAEGEVVSCNAV